jgi:hypothetical protein
MSTIEQHPPYPDNPAAALYRRWGFRERARLWVIQRRPLAAQ